MNEIITKKNIKNMIYEVRGKQVMLDSDLAKLYNVETKRINEAVNRNREKFPERFSFRLTDEESQKFLVAICDQKSEMRGGRYKNPRVFTEQGVAMLATILKSPIATKVSISIMDAFVEMRKFINENKALFLKLNNVECNLLLVNNRLEDHENSLNALFSKFEKNKEIKEKIFYDGEIYDAYSLLINIIREAKERIIIIDSYIDKTIFDILSYKDENIKVEIWTNTLKSKLDYDKFNLQYENVEIKKVNNIHDRFIIIDDNKIYHVGASLKDLGKKCFAITKMNKENINYLIKKYSREI